MYARSFHDSNGKFIFQCGLSNLLQIKNWEMLLLCSSKMSYFLFHRVVLKVPFAFSNKLFKHHIDHCYVTPNTSCFYLELIASEALLISRNIFINLNLISATLSLNPLISFLLYVTSWSVFINPTKLWPEHHETDLINDIVDAVQRCYTG